MIYIDSLLPNNIACFWFVGGYEARKEILSCDGFGTLRRILLQSQTCIWLALCFSDISSHLSLMPFILTFDPVDVWSSLTDTNKLEFRKMFTMQLSTLPFSFIAVHWRISSSACCSNSALPGVKPKKKLSISDNRCSQPSYQPASLYLLFVEPLVLSRTP